MAGGSIIQIVAGILDGSIVLVAGSYLAARLISRWWESFIAYGQTKYDEIYGDVPALPQDATTLAKGGGAAKQGPSLGTRHIAHDRKAL